MKKGILLLMIILQVSVVFAAGKINKVDFVDACVLDVVNILAAQAGLDVVLSCDSSELKDKKTTLHLKEIEAEDAIDYVLRTNGLNYEQKDKVLLVSASQQSNSLKGEIATIYLKYLSSEKVTDLLQKVMPSLRVTAGGSTNAVILQASSDQVNEARKLVDSIDKPVPQVLIESKVIEIAASDSMRLGIIYGNTPGTVKFITDKTTKKTSLAEDIQTTVNALITDGKAKVIATPRIATLNNQEAVINIGSRIPYAVPVSGSAGVSQWAVEYIDAGVKLKITPVIGQEKYITTSLQPEVSAVSEWKSTIAGEFPVITTRNAQATLRVKDGETIVVGGLLSESDRETITRIPVLGYIPLLGMLFQNKITEKEKNEVVFLITPHII